MVDLAPGTLCIVVPESLSLYRPFLGHFFAAMIEKLHKNSHKSTPTRQTFPAIIELLRGEVAEMEEQFASDHADPNMLYESADTANYAFLAWLALHSSPLKNPPMHRPCDHGFAAREYCPTCVPR